MKFKDLKTTEEYYEYTMRKQAFRGHLPWDKLKPESQEWWRQTFVRERRERFEKGIKDDLDY